MSESSKPGDNLPLMTYRIYGDPTLYPFVARENGLESVRDLKVGASLRFPPAEVLLQNGKSHEQSQSS